jgi:secretory phospholipase A2
MEIPYGKLAIYILTFIGYIYSGYGSGLLDNLREAVLTAEHVFGNVFRGVFSAAGNFRELSDAFMNTVEEECIYKCPNGALPVPNRNHKPSANGCGPIGFKLDSNTFPLSEMVPCCDIHDMCYDTCNRDKDICDLEFKRCLYNVCDGKVQPLSTACKATAKILHTGTTALGCKLFLDAQSNACFCGLNKRKNKKKKYTAGDEDL